MTFEETKIYISALAVRHQAPDSEYEELELSAFRAILRFALAEGWQNDPDIVNKTLFGADHIEEDDDVEDDEYTTWHYMELLLNAFDSQISSGHLPPQTAALYTFWKTEFWGPNHFDEV